MPPQLPGGPSQFRRTRRAALAVRYPPESSSRKRGPKWLFFPPLMTTFPARWSGRGGRLARQGRELAVLGVVAGALGPELSRGPHDLGPEVVQLGGDVLVDQAPVGVERLPGLRHRQHGRRAP